jgi:hypothetical protein
MPPAVRLVLPLNGTVFKAPATIHICAAAFDRDGHVVSVEFFQGTNSLGVRTNLSSPFPTDDFCITWSNAPAGDYVLTAKATDNLGASTTSDPVNISVQAPSGLPLVSIHATDPFASEAETNTGTFTVYRSGGTNASQDLTVVYAIGGTASNGVDYVQIPSSVTIPGGSNSSAITITPINDVLAEGVETVVLTLQTNGTYLLGPDRSATVFIADDDRITNSRPVVHITAPTNGAVFAGPVDIPITAVATDADDAVVSVDFFANDRHLGQDAGTNKAVYSLAWSNASRGFYLLTVVARDSRGGVGSSSSVHITISGTNPPPPTNAVVTIFATDPIAFEGTNFWFGHTNEHGTNWLGRTNTATFVVRRTGPTNLDLTVGYNIGGTASNGVDYLTIPDSVTIPAGERSAKITIVPIDDNIPEPIETVILRLLQPTNNPVPYLVGWPGKAEAIIIDNDSRMPVSGRLADGTFQVSAASITSGSYVVEFSPDLVHWLPVGTNTVSDIGVYFADPEAVDAPQRFYRVRPLQLFIGPGISDDPNELTQ